VSKYVFEAKIPVEHLTELFQSIKSGEYLDRKGETLQVAASIQGEVGALIAKWEGPAIVGGPATAAASVMSIEECIEEIEASINSNAPQMNPLVLAALMQLLKLVIDRLAS